MDRPIFLICQGRSGGTIVAHALAESLPDTTMVNEPLHDELVEHAEAQAKRTPAHLRHDGVTDPWRGYVGVRFDAKVGSRAPVGQKLNWLDDLIRQVPQRPVIKLLRMWGNLGRLRAAFPDADFIYLQRSWEAQWESYNGLGFLRDYFGEWRHGYQRRQELVEPHRMSDAAFHQAIWRLAQAEAMGVADWCIGLRQVTKDPRGEGMKLAWRLRWRAFDAERFSSFFTRRSK